MGTVQKFMGIVVISSEYEKIPYKQGFTIPFKELLHKAWDLYKKSWVY